MVKAFLGLFLILPAFVAAVGAEDLSMSSASIKVSSVPWNLGEKLVFAVKVGILPAGEGVLEVRESVDRPIGIDQSKTAKTTHFVATANSNSFVDIFYKVRDKNESWLDLEKLVSHRFEQHNHEGKYILDQTVDFDWEKKRFKNEEDVQGRKPKVEEGDLTIPAVDTLSSLYVARLMDLKVGEDLTLTVHSGRYYLLLIKVLKREKVKVDAGTFDCFVVEPFLQDRGIFIQKGKKLQVWLTADERKLPVKMRAEIFIGQVSAELKSIQ